MTSFSYSGFNVPASLPAQQASMPAMLEKQRQWVLKRHSVRVIGQGKPPMLLCNGFGCSQRIWQHLTTALAVHHQVIVFDYVGAGASDLSAYNPQQYAMLEGYAQDVIEICQALDLREAIIVGHSVGATIALLAASQAPQYFAKTVLLAPSPYYLNEPGYYGGFERADMLHVLATMDEDYRGWATAFADMLMGSTNSPSLGEELAGFFCETDSTITRQFARVAFLSDHRAKLTQLQLPTLLVQCSDDVVGPPEVGAYMLHHLPQAKLVTLQTSGHCPHLSAPLETLAAIRAFVG